jgi:hypothetical protein
VQFRERLAELALFAVRAVDCCDQVVEIMIMLQPIGAAETLAEDAKILFGQKTYGDDALCWRRRCGLKLGHRKAATKHRADLCRKIRVGSEKSTIRHFCCGELCG